MARKTKKRYVPPGAAFEQRCNLLESVAAQFGVDRSEIRAVELLYHNGRQWTVTTQIERRINGHWHVEDWRPAQPRTHIE